jgi:predicted NAD/FAD-binding protein
MEAQYETQTSLAIIEANRKAQLRDEELKQTIEAQKAIVAQERERAERISKAIVDAEVVQALADAEYYKSRQEADAKLYKEMKAAEAEKEIFEAQSVGLKRLQAAFQGDNMATLAFVMLEQGLHSDLANINSGAVEDLKPNFHIWSTAVPAESISDK